MSSKLKLSEKHYQDLMKTCEKQNSEIDAKDQKIAQLEKCISDNDVTIKQGKETLKDLKEKKKLNEARLAEMESLKENLGSSQKVC